MDGGRSERFDKISIEGRDIDKYNKRYNKLKIFAKVYTIKFRLFLDLFKLYLLTN